MFKYQLGRKTKEIKFIDLYIFRIKVIVANILFDKYKHKVQDNQILKRAINNR